jgi:hypothetical protein
MAKRRKRIKKDIANLFSGRIWNARDGSRYVVWYRPRYGNNWPILINKSAIQRKATAVTFCLEAFEKGMISHVVETTSDDTLRDLLNTYLAAEYQDKFNMLKLALRPRLQRELRQVVEAVYLLVVPLGRIVRIAIVQVCFCDKQWSQFQIVSFAAKSGPKSNKKARVDRTRTYRFDSIRSPQFDLRKPENVAAQERVLQELDIERLMFFQFLRRITY